MEVHSLSNPRLSGGEDVKDLKEYLMATGIANPKHIFQRR